MHVISRTESTSSHTACLAHTDVLLLLVLALAAGAGCCFRVAAGTATPEVYFFFAVQAVFCMLAGPTLSVALRLAPSTFLAQYVRAPEASVLLKAIVAASFAQTLLVFWHLL
jgi:hypothetical protein